MKQKSINALRFLGMDAINKANSGHPGIVLGAAPMAYALYTNHLKIDVKNPDWINRDRFVLSAGHGSALLYALNHLSGFKLSIDDLKNFRQPGNTPGHPEYGFTEGVDTTSGPLGQGVSNAVGMAMAEAHLAAKFNEEGFPIIDHYTYALVGDGDLQEGVAMEALSLAGHLGLNKLIVLFDSNDIQLDGEVSLAFSEDHEEKFKSIGWNYYKIEDGNDLVAINSVLEKAKKQTEKPTFIEIKTIIGYGATDQGTSKVHGAPLGLEETQKLRKTLNWDYDLFEVPEEVYEDFRKSVFNRGRLEAKKWRKLLSEYESKYPEKGTLFKSYFNGVTVDVEEIEKILSTNQDATRNVSGKIINKLSEIYPNLIGGSADLTASTKAKGVDGDFTKDNRLGRNINFGVREHAMGAIINGMVLHGGLKVFGGAFFVFSDYMKPAIRLSALMGIPSIFVFSHDSIAVGEDGPTHQPVEQLAGLRAIPNLNVIRPADAKETLFAWKTAIESKNIPTVIILTRQNVINHYNTDVIEAAKGAYIVSKEKNNLDGIIIASGSELELAIETQKNMFEKGKDIRVVSMPSPFLFDMNTQKYKNEILPKSKKKIAIELGSTMSWYKYASFVYGIDKFGISAPANVALEKYGFTIEAFTDYVKKIFK